MQGGNQSVERSKTWADRFYSILTVVIDGYPTRRFRQALIEQFPSTYPADEPEKTDPTIEPWFRSAKSILSKRPDITRSRYLGFYFRSRARSTGSFVSVNHLEKWTVNWSHPLSSIRYSLISASFSLSERMTQRLPRSFFTDVVGWLHQRSAEVSWMTTC